MPTLPTQPIQPTDPNTVQAEPSVVAGTPSASAYGFIAALNASDFEAAEKIVAPVEMELFGLVSQAITNSPKGLWSDLVMVYIRDCAVSKVVFGEVKENGDSAEVPYRLELRNCIPVEQRISLVRQAGVWKIAKLNYPPTMITAISRKTQAYASNIFKAANAFLAENPSESIAALNTDDCTKGYVRGSYSVPDSKGLLTACRVETAGHYDIRVTVRNVFGEIFTIP